MPPPRSEAEARQRFLAHYASDSAPTRGSGSISIRREGAGRRSVRARWAEAGDSVVVVGYVGPVRALDLVLLGDSLYLGLRPYDTGLKGTLSADAPIDARTARFLARPWHFGDPWIRGAVERATVEPLERGVRLTGSLEDGPSEVRVALDLTPEGTPRMLRLSRLGSGDELVVRYGPPRGYALGRKPAWIEWTYRDVVARLEIEDLAPVDRSRIRIPAPAGPDWTILALDDPRSRRLFRRLFGEGAW